MAAGRMPVGVSILTNGNRREALQRCVASLLANCRYRPLVVGIYNNGSTDDTKDWVSSLPEAYGVTWRAIHSAEDMGCAHGTNSSIDLVKDCELQLHLESDFEHLPESMTGVDPMWMHRAVELLQSGDCDYLYLRRLRDESEAAMHWWDQWMPKVTEERGEYLRCPGFWWSNNPTLFNYARMVEAGAVPLDEAKDGPKGTPGWSQPELKAAKPSGAWIHRWGVFMHEVHEMADADIGREGCGWPGVRGGCKYGFYKRGNGDWCRSCDVFSDYGDMVAHRGRRKAGVTLRGKTVAFHLSGLAGRGTDTGSYNFAVANEEVLGNRSVFVVPRSGNNSAMARFRERFDVRLYDDWAEVDGVLADVGADLLHMRKSGEDDGQVSSRVRTAVHCAFSACEPHGDVYAYISEWLTGHATGGRHPWVPHIVTPMPAVGDMREELGIPADAVVFGRHGGWESFDLGFVHKAVQDVAKGRSDRWFLFMGTRPFCELPNVVFLDAAYDIETKSRFVATCDAMLHGRERGETFGLAIAEFSAMGRPVLTWGRSPEKAHLAMLGAKAQVYDWYDDLAARLTGWDLRCGSWWDAYTEKFSPRSVMRRFRSAFL